MFSSLIHSHYNTTKQVLTLLLTVVAFKLMIKEQLPSVPYMTDLDKYAFCSSITKYVSFQNTHTHTQVHLRSNDHAVCSGIYALASQEIWYLRRFDVFSNSCGFLRASTHLGSLGFVRCVLRVRSARVYFLKHW